MNLLKAFILGLALSFGACTTQPIGGVDKTLYQPLQQAQAAVNEYNALLTAAASVVAQNVKDGIWTKAEGAAYVAKLEDLAKKVDSAQSLVRIGDPKAGDQAALVKTLVTALHREIAAKARQ